MRPGFFIPFILIVSVCAGCSESLPKHFDDIDGVYFNYRLSNGMVSDSAAFTFVYVDEDVLDVEIPVQLMGRCSQEDREIRFSAASRTAVSGMDYLLPEALSLPAGATTVNLAVRLFRTLALKSEEKVLEVELQGTDNFIIPFRERFTLSFCDLFTVAPDGWQTMFAGSFSQAKFELLCKVTGISRADFKDSGTISFAKWMYLLTEVENYIMEQQKLREAGLAYDPDAFDEDGKALSYSE